MVAYEKQVITVSKRGELNFLWVLFSLIMDKKFSKIIKHQYLNLFSVKVCDISLILMLFDTLWIKYLNVQSIYILILLYLFSVSNADISLIYIVEVRTYFTC